MPIDIQAIAMKLAGEDMPIAEKRNLLDMAMRAAQDEAKAKAKADYDYRADAYRYGADGMSSPGAAAAGQARGYTPLEKLMTRLNVRSTFDTGFEHLAAIDNPNGDNVVVFLIVRGEPLTFKDDRNLFPTDSLVGQLNTLRA